MKPTERTYRPEIDGLRALAVVLVIAFHVNAPHVRGGFVGVDVFFVISGYLITSIIAREIDRQQFSLAGFYERRARRILPALFTVLAVTTLLALRYLLPGELAAYAKSLLAATFSYSNILFWSTADYFDTPAQMKPLLHTWSLGVEEQFYLVLPLLLMAVMRARPRLRNAAVLALAAASFACAAWMVHWEPVGAFYLPFSRIWELLAGSILALGMIPMLQRRWIRELVAVAGIVLIVLAANRLSSNSEFPGPAALLPCGGALMILAACRSGSSVTGSVLSLRPFTFIGQISYSVYLWHWPLVVFTRMGFLPSLPRDNRTYAVSIFLLSLLIAAASWQFVEKPFRTGVYRKMRRGPLFVTCGCAAAVLGCVSLVFIRTDGMPWRFPAGAIDLAAQMENPVTVRRGMCFIDGSSHFKDFRADICLHLDPARKNYLLLGDSHSAVLWYGISTQMAGANILQATASGCRPNVGSARGEDCIEMMNYVFGTFLVSHRVDAILLSARWYRESDFAALKETADWCNRHGIPLIILGPVMEYDTPLPKLLAYSLAFHDPGLIRRHMRVEMFDWDRGMRQEATHYRNSQYVSLMDAQCPNEECLNYADAEKKTVLLKDDNHLSDAGSVLIVKKLLDGGALPPRSGTETTGRMPVRSGE